MGFAMHENISLVQPVTGSTDCIYFLSGDLEAEAEILEFGQDDKGHFIVCDCTVFHAQGGGQKSDRGMIDGVEILSVTKRGTPQEFSVMHYLSAPLVKSAGDKITMQVNGETRALHSRLHSLGHLLAHVVDEAYPVLKAVQGHHWPDECRVEFAIANDASVAPDETHINDLLARAIAADLPVLSCFSPDQNRTVQIGMYEPVPCGGTHVATTRELVSGITRGIKIKGDRVRISYE